jgi:biotin operon repressor
MLVISQDTFKSSSAQAITPNGITQPTPAYTVLENGGISRPEPSLQGQDSGIYTVGWKSRGTIDNSRRGGKTTARVRKTTALDTKEFRSNQKLHTHRLDATVKLETLDVERTIKELTQLLDYREYMTRETDGKKFRTTVIKERRGETITISYEKKEKKYVIHITTHDLTRLEKFRGYVNRVLQMETYTLELEAYIRYHEKDELKTALAILSIAKEIGKRVKIDIRPHRGRYVYYLLRANLQYKGARVVLKTYRHESFGSRKPTDPEFHPKIEQLTVLKNASTLTQTSELLKEYTTLIYTVAYTLNLKTIEGEYERQHTTTFETQIDPQIQRMLRGIKSKIKAETLLEHQYTDKRMAIARLLDKGLRPVDIARLLGYSRQYVTRIIKQLLEEGVIIRVKRGVYKLNPKYKPKEERQVIEHHGDIKDLLELVKENKESIVEYCVDGTPYIDIKEEHVITRYIFSRLSVGETETQLLAGYRRVIKAYTFGRRELERWIRQILEG